MIDKYVCIEGSSTLGLLEGKVYEIDPEERVLGGLVKAKSDYGIVEDVAIKRFLKLPSEPKTCVDMTMEEYLAMACLSSGSPPKQ